VLDVSSKDLLHSVFQTVAYADVFDYPLTAPEVYRYLTSTKASFEEVVRTLTDDVHFGRVGDYFTLRGREGIVETRNRRAKIAARLWARAGRYGRIIASLPFVRMVAVTGSLAMNNTDEGTDIDYMIVASPNRLWTCRALTLLVARIAKLEGINLCPNYLVTTNALKLSEHSLYVAHEMVQMIPLAGMETYLKMLRLNEWIYEYLPNASTAPELLPTSGQAYRQSFIQRVLEIALSLPFGNWLENWEMNRKISKLTREQSSSFESYFSADVCKGHIDKHGENVLTALAVRLQKTI
jgi:predicted nucleotidyltransferase